MDEPELDCEEGELELAPVGASALLDSAPLDSEASGVASALAGGGWVSPAPGVDGEVPRRAVFLGHADREREDVREFS